MISRGIPSTTDRGSAPLCSLKGCVLRCRWCCNPESQRYEIETMKVAGKPKIIGRDVTVGEVMETVERDRGYYRRSGGGLTLSGGESLCQPKFAAALLETAVHRGITTAMESMGCASWEVIESILPWLDTYLMDIKHMNPAKHEAFTGPQKRSDAGKCEKDRSLGHDGAGHPGAGYPDLQ